MAVSPSPPGRLRHLPRNLGVQLLPFWPGGLILLLLSLGTGIWALQLFRQTDREAAKPVSRIA